MTSWDPGELGQSVGKEAGPSLPLPVPLLIITGDSVRGQFWECSLCGRIIRTSGSICPLAARGHHWPNDGGSRSTSTEAAVLREPGSPRARKRAPYSQFESVHGGETEEATNVFKFMVINISNITLRGLGNI